VAATGIDPTRNLLAAAHQQDPTGKYFEGEAASLPFDDASFNLVVSYLSLVDIPDVVPAIAEMVRVLRPGGRLLVANLNGFNTAGVDIGWSRAWQQEALPDRSLLARAIGVDRISRYPRPEPPPAA
jgi:ubiquinone/menaquinone biosynthesis C-methylase UbiE